MRPTPVPRRPARGLVAVPLSALLLLTGCGGGGTQEAASTSGSGAPSSSSAAPTTATGSSAAGSSAGAGVEPGAESAPPFAADVSTDTADPVAGTGPTVVTGVRVAQQDGYARVVFDVAGEATPGWDVAYTDSVTQDGSGRPLDVPPGTYLRVSLTGITNPYEAPDVAEAPTGYTAVQAAPVQGVEYASVFEGQALAYVGTTGQQPFRVFALSNPTRVVVDVRAS